MRWVMLVSFCRIILSNEMKANIKLNGNFIKKVSSGGDPNIGRLHCGNETSFTTHFLPILFANDTNEITPYDDAVDNRVRLLSYTKNTWMNPTRQIQMNSEKTPTLKKKY